MIIDIVIGMVIVGLIAVIAVSALGQWRVKAYNQAVLEDSTRLGQMLNARLSEKPVQQAAARSAATGSFRASPAVSTSAPSTVTTAGSDGSDFDMSSITDPIQATGIRLYDGNRIGAGSWTTDGDDFGFCIEHVTDGTGPDAWAAYRSDRGGIYESGRQGGCDALDGGVGNGSDEGSDEGEGEQPDEEPTTPTPTTPTPTTPTPTTPPVTTPPVTNPGGTGGTGDQPGIPQPTQEPIPAPANDTCNGAIEIVQSSSNDGVTSSGTATNLGATEESSVWFRTWAPISMYSTYAIEAPDGGRLSGTRTMTVYRGPDTNTNTGICPPEGQMTALATVISANPGYVLRTGTGNQNYYIKVTSAEADQADFRVRLYVHRNEIVRDRYGSAEPISISQNQSQTFNHHLSTNLWGAVENGELAPGYSTMWYRLNNYYSTATPRYTLATLAPSDPLLKAIGDHKIEVFSGGSGAGSPGTLIATASGNGAASVTFDGPNSGGSMMIRITSTSGLDAGYFNLRLSRGAN